MKKIRKMAISVTLPIDLIAYLDNQAEETRTSVSTIIQSLVEDDKFLTENSKPYTGEVEVND